MSSHSRAAPPSVSLVLFVLMSGCIIMEKSLLTAVSQPKEKQTKERTIYPSTRKVPIVQAVVTSNQWLSYVSFCCYNYVLLYIISNGPFLQVIGGKLLFDNIRGHLTLILWFDWSCSIFLWWLVNSVQVHNSHIRNWRVLSGFFFPPNFCSHLLAL